MEKIWLVRQESNFNGEFHSNAVPCISEEVAKKMLKQGKDAILSESARYKKYGKENFKIVEDDTHYFIKDLFDDYYEYVLIEEKEIVLT